MYPDGAPGANSKNPSFLTIHCLDLRLPFCNKQLQDSQASNICIRFRPAFEYENKVFQSHEKIRLSLDIVVVIQGCR
jgi:hypothetical protein